MNILYIVLIAVPILALSIAFHEMVHAYIGYKLGDDTAKLHGRISLNPLKHIDPLTTVALPLIMLLLGLPPFGAAKPVPFNPSRIKYDEFGVAMVAAGGPLSNLFLAAFSGIVVTVFNINTGGLFGSILMLFAQINLGFFLFNMIPFPPLDGSRVLYAFAPEPIQKLMVTIEQLGFIGLAIFIFFFYRFFQPVLYNGMEFFLRILNLS